MLLMIQRSFRELGKHSSSVRKHLESGNTTESCAFNLAHSQLPHFKTQNLSTKPFPQNWGMEPYFCSTCISFKPKHVLLSKTIIRMMQLTEQLSCLSNKSKNNLSRSYRELLLLRQLLTIRYILYSTILLTTKILLLLLLLLLHRVKNIVDSMFLHFHYLICYLIESSKLL